MTARLRQLIYFATVGYLSWVGMMAVHESSHAIAGWLTGGHVQRVLLPMWGFSRTDVFPNPKPLIEVLAGPIWGSVLPLLICVLLRKPPKVLLFFAGFCLIANGGYLGVGWTVHAGDAWQLVQLGMPRWLLTAIGAMGMTFGLVIWHSLGTKQPINS